MTCTASIRSYRDPGVPHAHAHAQIVLPIAGILDVDVEGRRGRLDCGVSAFIAPGVVHTQAAVRDNLFLVLDCDRGVLPARALASLSHRTFFVMPPAVRLLVDYAATRSRLGGLDPSSGEALARLLVDGLEGVGGAADPLASLRQAVLRAPAADWRVARLAAHLGVSRTRLYRLIAEEAGATPARFVAGLRVEAAMRAIEAGTMSLAEVAAWAGFADQAAMTRAMRREAGCTPGAWRRHVHGTIGQ